MSNQTKKIAVNAMVVFPIYINQTIELKEGEDLKEKILKVAENYLQNSTVNPLIFGISQTKS